MRLGRRDEVLEFLEPFGGAMCGVAELAGAEPAPDLV
jgi:hypothetical protein